MSMHTGSQVYDGEEQVIAVSALGVVIVVVVLVVSGILICSLLHSKRMQRRADQQQQRVDYVNVTRFIQQPEPIQLKANPAYEPVTIPH